MINLTAPINNLGYGIAGYNILNSLIKLGERVSLFPMGPVDQMPNMDSISEALSFKSVSQTAPSVKIWHQHDIHHHVGKELHVGFPIFELDRFSQAEARSISYNDRVFVCSDWAKNIVMASTSVKDIQVVPLGVDTSLFKPMASNRDATIFFNCGKWEVRKGHDVLGECFNEAFSASDNVELWMMCENPFLGEENSKWIRQYQSTPLGDKIRIIPRQPSQKDVYNIMRQTDCGVFPSRAEGWNLELLEMMACGKSVIATNYSAHTEFCTPDNARLIPITSLEQAHDDKWFFGNGNWGLFGETQKQLLVSNMREVHEAKQNGSLDDNYNGVITAKTFSWENSAKKFLEGLE